MTPCGHLPLEQSRVIPASGIWVLDAHSLYGSFSLCFFHVAWAASASRAMAADGLQSAKDAVSPIATWCRPHCPFTEPPVCDCPACAASILAVLSWASPLFCCFCWQAGPHVAIAHLGLPSDSHFTSSRNGWTSRQVHLLACPMQAIPWILCVSGFSWVHLVPADHGLHVGRPWVQRWCLENGG